MDIYPLKNLVLLNVFMKIISDSSGQDTAHSTISELDKYLNDLLIDYKIWNPCNLWAQHYREFPTLSIQARHFLSVPATSVSSMQRIIFSCWRSSYMMRKEIECYLTYLMSYSYKVIHA